jgi:hypothetical protein
VPKGFRLAAKEVVRNLEPLIEEMDFSTSAPAGSR